MHRIFNTHDVVFLILQMVHAMIINEDSFGLGDFAALATTSSAISEAILQLLWKQLPSVEPLIYLLPNDLIQEHTNSNKTWELRFLRTPKLSDLERFHFYAQKVKAIYADGKALRPQHKHVFQTLLTLHNRSRSAGFLMPYLSHVVLKDNRDHLIQFLDQLLLPGLQSLVLPSNMLIFPDVVHLLGHLQTLVYISDSFHTNIILNSLSNCLSMHHLTLCYTQPTSMTSIASLDQLTTLTLIIIPGSSIMEGTGSISNQYIRTHILYINVESDQRPSHDPESISTDTGFSAIISILSNHRIICQGLSINIHQQYCSTDFVLHFFNVLTSLHLMDDEDDGFLDWENLVALRLRMPWEEDFFSSDPESLQIPRDGLAALSRLVYLTALELEDLGTCRIDDDALRSLAIGMGPPRIG
ncbi:hypothetical protein BDR07DRAFT_1494676 [Suillus spraguei]|nr:hypothetical protein BDR07DRAFT_1494676 [Suillus spraguei]